MKFMKKNESAFRITIRNSNVRNWINSRDLINIAALCRKADYNRGAFSRFLEGHQDLKEENLAKIETALADYGYKP